MIPANFIPTRVLILAFQSTETLWWCHVSFHRLRMSTESLYILASITIIGPTVDQYLSSFCGPSIQATLCVVQKKWCSVLNTASSVCFHVPDFLFKAEMAMPTDWNVKKEMDKHIYSYTSGRSSIQRKSKNMYRSRTCSSLDKLLREPRPSVV